MLYSVLIMGTMIMNFCTLANAWAGDTKALFGSEELLKGEFDSYKNLGEIAVGKIEGKDMPVILSRLKDMPNLVTLEFHDCDLSQVDEKSPVPEKVKAVLIANGKISQGAVRWLAKFPTGRVLTFGCDTRGLTFDLGTFKWLTFDNCEVSRSAVLKLVEKMTQVTFKEVTLIDDK